jgi:hypothetical protein
MAVSAQHGFLDARFNECFDLGSVTYFRLICRIRGVMEASCRETFVIIDNGGLSDKGIALMQGFQHMNSIIKAEFKSVADKIRLRRGLLIVVKLIREYR